MNRFITNRLASIAVGLALVALFGAAQAADDPTGTWKWETSFGGKTRESTLKLKQEGDILTGAMLGRDNREIPIENASFKDDQISFTITREINNQRLTMKYHGTLKGDTITGKTEFARDGQTQSRDWEAKRQK